MSSQTVYQAPRRHNVSKMRVHDYLYDSAYIVSGARDYARAAFRAAMASAQIVIQPVYSTMFSELRKCPRMRVVYHPNCRLPHHIDRSFGGYLRRVEDTRSLPAPQLAGRDRFQFNAMPKKLLATKTTCPEFHPPTPNQEAVDPTRPINKGMQTVFRESSAQTHPWQPEGKPSAKCNTTPEVLYLDKLEWGPGIPYRCGDLPADFHTTEIINKMRHARQWLDLVEKGHFPKGMKKRDAIITDVETKDWIFREAEIDELQEIRLALLHKIQAEQRTKKTTRVGKKLSKLWNIKKQEMERKIDNIHKTRDREVRKLEALHEGGGRVGLVRRLRAARGGGDVTSVAHDPASHWHAPLARHGYQARRRHANITYDPTLLVFEDHQRVAEPPSWLTKCGQDLSKTCSGHHLPQDQMKLCERETKWSEQFLENLHNDLKKTRLGAVGTSPGPLRLLKPRRVEEPQRPSTPEVEPVHDDDENNYQAALTLQRVLRGRAVQYLMYEGRMRAAELTEELKTTHGLENDDKIRIAEEEAKAREFNVMSTAAEQKEKAISALVDELCGGAVSAALDFLEKELRRLKEERRQHAFILIALREKTMREAAEAGRRQKEEHRRREHDQMFKQVLGVTQETVDSYLKEIVTEGVELYAEENAVAHAEMEAERVEASLKEQGTMSTAEQNELVAELVQHFLLPEAHKIAARKRITDAQKAGLEMARKSIFGLLDEATAQKDLCIRCGEPLDELCRCRSCQNELQPTETEYRHDHRWRHTRSREQTPEKTIGERFPPYYEFRCMLNNLVDEVVVQSRRARRERGEVSIEYNQDIRERVEIALDARSILDAVIDDAIGVTAPPVKRSDYHYVMRRVVSDALERTEPPRTSACPEELPSEVRRRALQEVDIEKPWCKCEPPVPRSRLQFGLGLTPTVKTVLPQKRKLLHRQREQIKRKRSNKQLPALQLELMSEEEKQNLLPSELRILEDMRRCKCDTDPAPSPESDLDLMGEEFTEEFSPGDEEK